MDARRSGVWDPSHRRLTVSLVLTVTLVAFESLAVATVLPVISRHLGDVRLYGWVFSAFFLGSLVGIVVAGGLADRRPLALPFGAGLVLFGVGLAIGGAAQSMPVLVAGRTLQGIGAGAIPAAVYVGIGRGYSPELRPRMFAVTSTAWVVPGLIGPALAGLVADHIGWRWVFLGLLPVVVLAGVLTLPAVRRIAPPPNDEPSPIAIIDALRVAGGSGLVLAGLTVASPGSTAGLIVVGALVGVPAFLRLVPPGTLRARPGLPAAVLARGLLTFAFFGADAYVPFTLSTIRGASATMAGVALTAATLAWTVGSWVQERKVATVGPRRLIRIGLGFIAAGIAGMATLFFNATTVWFGPVAWAVAGFGMGVAYAPISLVVLQEAKPGQEGRASAAMQISDVLGTAFGTGVGGAAVALGHGRGWDSRVGVALAFGIAAAVGLAALGVARRLPDSLATAAAPRA
jgi:MFS family permease